MPASELIAKTATEIVALLKAGEVTTLDLLDALEGRIAEVEPAVNALPTLCFERAREAARALAAKPVAERGVLAGMPVAIKDLVNVAGVRSTQGSPIFADFVPETSDVVVTTLEAAGGVIYAKANTPEFGAGANTFNEVFGRTLNPWDTSKSCAGSSGGSAVALATGTAWMASGSDLGGSLRNPASFCGIVGFRPTPGRVAHGPAALPYNSMSVEGPMARTVADCALMLDAMCGQTPVDPISLERPAVSFVDAVAARRAPKRVAFSRDLGGITPVDPEVADIVERAARRFEAMGCTVEEASPDFADVQMIFQTMRAMGMAAGKKDLLATHRDQLKPEVIWNIEKGLELTMADIAAAELARGRYYHRVRAFYDRYDLVLCPATVVPPYPIEDRYVAECQGHTFSNYIEWCTVAYAFTCAGLPAISVPAGFTAGGLPVGLQIAGPPRGEAAVLAAAAMFEDIAPWAHTLPVDPRGPKG
ncbi:amidase family protein [Thalassobaculum sp.]|uniref:amidase n=1 Tax=Thalassobaculum sp. TaxID=2022740 RepID=UPI0032ED09AC